MDKLQIEECFSSMEAKKTWTLKYYTGTQPLQTHVVLNVNGKSGGNIERFKEFVFAGGILKTYGD